MAVLSVLVNAFLGVAILVVSNLLWTYLNSPLKSIPGPFLAKFTNLWRFFDVWGGRPELTLRMLHQKYGAAVRIGPNDVSLSDPSLIKTIYPIRGDFLKSSFYSVNDVKAGKVVVSNMFSTRSNDYHNQQVKPIQKHYTPNGLMEYEPLVDKTIGRFREKLEERFIGPGKACDIDRWLLFFAWDVIGEMTFSEPMGFLEKGADIDDILGGADRSLDYFALIGQIPQLDFLLDKNPIHRIGPASFGTVVTMSVQRTMARLQGTDGHNSEVQKDFLDRFIEKKKEADWVDDNQVVGWLLVNMFAGADTTGITLRAILYYTLKNPRVHKALRSELDAANLSFPITHKEAQSLPYLSAVIEEATRMHPAVGLPLERIVPASGLTLPDGRYIAPGTIVGMNPWVVHHNKPVFGQDAESFNPDRWLQGPDESVAEWQARRSRMREADLTFGAGNRVCMGKSLALLEVYKVVATLFAHYQMDLVDPTREWQVQNSWFVRQKGLDVNIRLRS